MSKKKKDPIQKSPPANGKVSRQGPFVIGIGASAGGLQALESLFKHISRDSVAFVIVQHLTHDHRDYMTEILNQYSDLRFREATSNLEVEANQVYLTPAGKYLTIVDNRLQLNDRPAETTVPRTIDTFFKSLAADKGHRAIGVILSGTGTDGTEGIMAIKKAGGLVLVQEPETAKFDGMPRSAINTGLADFVLPPDLMPDEIFNHVMVSPLTEKVTAVLSKNEPSFVHILDIVRERTGVDFSEYKRPTLVRRISRRMAIHNIDSLLNYLDYLQLHPEEIETLSKEFLIGVTRFFRDPEAFETLRQTVIPILVQEKTLRDQLRIWVVACSTGEEAYSIALLLREYLDQHQIDLEVKIFASDIDREALDQAGTGIYFESAVSDIPELMLQKYFIQEEGQYQISQRIRRMVIFAQHNVANDPPFGKMDLISCRNMLIYLAPALQKKVLAKFHYSLQINGYLLLGPSESIGDQDGFQEIHKKWKIFRNISRPMTLGVDNFISSKVSLRRPDVEVPLRAREMNTRQKVHLRLSEILNDAVLEEYGFAAIYIDENYDLIYGFGDYNKYLALPERQFTFNLLKLVSPDLAVNLGNMLRRAVRDKEKIIARGLQMRDGDLIRQLNVVIKPYLSDKKVPDRFILVLIKEDLEKSYPMSDLQVFGNEIHYETRVHELEVELQNTKEDLQSVVEELETANEELQSTNEELLSSNEELQSANEELQSLNEELNTINAEHQYKIKVLMELDDDLNNFFRSTDIGQVFVDRHLIIRKFTPAATHQINLIESDIGRSLDQITHNINHPGLLADIRNTMNHSEVFEREVQDQNGTWFLLRILPYLTQDRITDGAIIIFVNIHELKNLHLMQASILNSSPNAILALKAIRNNLGVVVDFACTLLNNKAEELLGKPKTALLDKPLSKVFPKLLQDGLFDRYQHVIGSGETLDVEQEQPVSAYQTRWIHLIGVKQDERVVLTIQDITHRKVYEQNLLQHQEEIHASAEQFRTLLEAVPHITWTSNAAGENESVNQTWYDYTGLSERESLGRNWLQALNPEEVDNMQPDFEESLRTGTTLTTQAQIRRRDGEYRWHLIKMVPIRKPEGLITLWIGTATDIQDQKDAEQLVFRNKLKQQKEILQAILRTQETERIQLSEALHNSLGQILYAAKLTLVELSSKETRVKKAQATIENFLDEAINSARNISFELTPTILKDFGLETALQELIRRLQLNNLRIDFDVEGFEERPPYDIEIALYRIIQELINNIIKHARATEALVELVNEDQHIHLRVQDNGVGLDPALVKAGQGIGLSSIRNRVELLNGKLEIDSRPGKGTAFLISFELNK